MTIERAIEILDPEHREHYESIDIVNEACRMGMEALERQMAKKPVKPAIEKDSMVLFGVIFGSCPNCGFKVYSNINKFCTECGQKLDWEI